MNRFSAWVCTIALCGSAACTGGPGSIPSSSGGFGSSDLESAGDDDISENGGPDRPNSSSGNANGSSGGSTGGDTVIRASDYDQSCETAADCYPIYEGLACEQCACPNAAIARSGAASYVTKKALAGCEIDTDVQCDACVTTTECTSGKCTVSH